MTLALLPKPGSDTDFLAVFNRLCVALREQQDDSGITQGVYFDALKDLPLPALEAGAQALMKEPGRRFFPTTAEWRTAAERCQGALLREAVQRPEAHPWTEECSACSDTGWEPHVCDGGEAGRCGRRNKHAAHDYVTICPCRPTNRTWNRHHHFGAGV